MLAPVGKGERRYEASPAAAMRRLMEGELLRAELLVLDGLGGRLLVVHPHSLVEPLAPALAAALSGRVSVGALSLAALGAANDAMRTDMPLLCPPQARAHRAAACTARRT